MFFVRCSASCARVTICERKLAEQHNGYHATRRSSEALLMGRIFDDRGNRMTPSHSRKEGKRHRYYVSSALVQGRPEAAGSVSRLPAAKVEVLVVEAVRHHIGCNAPADNAELISAHVGKVEVRRPRSSFRCGATIKPRMMESTLLSFSLCLGARRLASVIARS
jgi:hypothetical protein